MVPLRVLIVEDSEDDAALIVRELRQGGYEPIFKRVETALDMEAALAEQGSWELIISDYTMPQFNAVAALKLVRESGLDLPFVIVSGTVGEEIAVQAMKAGACDYLLKDNLAVVPLVQRQLHDVEVRVGGIGLRFATDVRRTVASRD